MIIKFNEHSRAYEQATPIDKFYLKASHIAEDLFFHCTYFLVYDMPETDNHWKKEVFGFVKPLKEKFLKSGDKYDTLQMALVEDDHGEHFSEDRDDVASVMNNVYKSEEHPHPFSFDMTLGRNRDVYFEALDKFYYEFLLPWIAKTDKDPDRQELFDGIDKYLISRRKEMA